MKRIIVFSGTTEGRILSEQLSRAKIFHTVSVATEYGRTVMRPGEYVRIVSGRMDEESMKSFILENGEIVCDATHPYALKVTEQIRKICEELHKEYVRIIRTRGRGLSDTVIKVKDNKEAVDMLKDLQGNILLTTGSRDIEEYIMEPGLLKRLFIRVLPSTESMAKLEGLGVSGRQIIAMQGPFSVNMNKALIKEYDIKWMVTKESGTAGGFEEKIKAADDTDTGVIVITRSDENEGISLFEMINRLGIPLPVEISLVGTGPGDAGMMTVAAREELNKADVVFGAERMLKDVGSKRAYPCYMARDVIPILKEEMPRRAAILFSGDTGFFSGAALMRSELLKWRNKEGIDLVIKTYPGISSISMLAAKTGESYDGSPVVSLHGRSGDVLSFYRAAYVIGCNKKTYVIFSGADDVKRLCEILKETGITHCDIKVGLNLSYADENIMEYTSVDDVDIGTDGLFAAVVINHEHGIRLLNFIKDDAFVRGRVPMTKEMIRHMIMIRLELKSDSVLYDVGSGTGSVSIEAAGLHPDIRVFAIEKDHDAAMLTGENADRFFCRNICIVEEEAPGAFGRLPAPTHVFIGGSSGRLFDIISYLAALNKKIRIVVSAVSLDSISQCNEILKMEIITNPSVEQIGISRGKKLGDHTLMLADNPVYLYAFDLGEKSDG